MHVSASGRARLIEAFEGERLIAYLDAVGVWTIGYGHTCMAGAPRVVRGMRITSQNADEILTADLFKTETMVGKLLRVAPTQTQFDALNSITFNIGIGNFQSSSLLRAFNAGDNAAAAAAFMNWNRAGGRVIDGLTRRREAERAWFLNKANSAPVVVAGVHLVDHPQTVIQRIANRVALAVKQAA